MFLRPSPIRNSVLHLWRMAHLVKYDVPRFLRLSALAGVEVRFEMFPWVDSLRGH